MVKEQENSFWSELWDAIKFCKESKSGKYSLDTYLDIVGEYTDIQIKAAEQVLNVNFYVKYTLALGNMYFLF